jgi:hypothetical protein
MTHHRLGHKDEAQRYKDQAIEQIDQAKDPRGPEVLISRRLLAEAEAVLKQTP